MLRFAVRESRQVRRDKECLRPSCVFIEAIVALARRRTMAGPAGHDCDLRLKPSSPRMCCETPPGIAAESQLGSSGIAERSSATIVWAATLRSLNARHSERAARRGKGAREQMGTRQLAQLRQLLR